MNRFTERNDEFYMAVADMAMDMFNRQIGTDYSEDTIEICLVTEENGDEKIPAFLENFKEVVEPIMLVPGYVSTIRAEALVTKERLGMIIRTDLEGHDMQWRHMVLHELGHIFCTQNELESKEKFFNKYCIHTENKFQDGAINAGYAIWREFIAEFMATILDEDMFDNYLEQMKDHCYFMLDEIEAMVDDDKYCLSALLIDIMTTVEVLHALEFSQALEKLKSYDRVVNSKTLLGIVELVFDQIAEDEPWVIDVDFIETLGNAFLMLKTEIIMRNKGI